MKKEYYEIQWFDNSYAGCWRFQNRFETLNEAKEFINSNKCISGVDLRIMYKTEEIIEVINK